MDLLHDELGLAGVGARQQDGELVVSVEDFGPGVDDAALAAWVEEQLRQRAEARGRRDFGQADAIRQAIEEKGIAIEDAAGGTRWKVVR